MTSLTTRTTAHRRTQTMVAVGAAVVAVAAMFLLPYVAGTYFQQVGYLVTQYAALATAWNLLAGYGGLISLGTGAFVGIGAYTMAELGNHTGLPLLILLPLAGAAAALFAVLVSPAMFRLRGLYFAIGTLALAEALRILMINVNTFGGANGIFLKSSAPPTYALYWLALGLAVLATLAVVAVLAGPLSLSLRAVRDDEDVAKEMGLVTYRTKLWAFALSAFIIGLVGGVQAVNLGAVEPYGAFGLSWTIDTVAVAIIGGLATRIGPWVGALFIVVLGQLLQDYPEVHVAITGVVLLLVIRLARRGLWGSLPLARLRARGRDVGAADG
jgi:branched-chain amino acid transport system permease protein